MIAAAVSGPESVRLIAPSRAVFVILGQAGEYVGWLGGFRGLDGPASAQITRDLLGWQPTRPGLIADLKEAASSLGRPGSRCLPAAGHVAAP
jgi:hypothetical protein